MIILTRGTLALLAWLLPGSKAQVSVVSIAQLAIPALVPLLFPFPAFAGALDDNTRRPQPLERTRGALLLLRMLCMGCLFTFGVTYVTVLAAARPAWGMLPECAKERGFGDECVVSVHGPLMVFDIAYLVVVVRDIRTAPLQPTASPLRSSTWSPSAPSTHGWPRSARLCDSFAKRDGEPPIGRDPHLVRARRGPVFARAAVTMTCRPGARVARR